MTDDGTLIMRRESLPPVRLHGETVRWEAHSLAPFAIHISRPAFGGSATTEDQSFCADEEDHLPPARNSDVLGFRSTMDVDIGGSVTRTSFLAGASAGLTALALAGALAFASFTSEHASYASYRSPRLAARGHATLTVAVPELATAKAAPPKRRVKRVRVTEEAVAGLSTERAEEPAQAAPEAPESE